MMMHEGEEPWPAGHGAVPRVPTALDLPLLSRDDATWEEFQGSDGVAESALTGRCMTLFTIASSTRCMTVGEATRA